MSVEALHLRTAKAAVAMLRDGLCTPLQLIDAAERQIIATEPSIHATPIRCFDRARRAAAELVHPPNPPAG